MSERVRLDAMRKLRERVTRMVNMINNPGTPMSMIAFECGLIGDLESCLDPEGAARRLKEDEMRHAKQNLGICTDPGCEVDAVVDGLCHEHEADFFAQHEGSTGRRPS